MKRHLVVVRCGRRSEHPTWTEGGADLDFDLRLCPYEAVPAADARGVASDVVPGQKWAGLARFLAEERSWRRYAYVWLPDDDLRTTGPDIARLLDLCLRHDAALAAPALAEGSQHSHLVTLENRSFRARRTTFVEVMAPCFRRDVLERMLPTFAESRTGLGWGLDDAWCRLLGYRGIFVFDEVAVLHERPVGAARPEGLREAAKEEMRRLRRRYDACSLRKTLGGFDAAGGYVDERDPGFAPLYADGYRWRLDGDARARRRLQRAQALDPERWLAGAPGRARRAAWRARLLGWGPSHAARE